MKIIDFEKMEIGEKNFLITTALGAYLYGKAAENYSAKFDAIGGTTCGVSAQECSSQTCHSCYGC